MMICQHEMKGVVLSVGEWRPRAGAVRRAESRLVGLNHFNGGGTEVPP